MTTDAKEHWVIIPVTSPTPRAKKTAYAVQKALVKKLGWTRESSMIFSPLGWRPDFSPFENLFYKLVKEEWRSVEEVCKKFWNNELEIKPEMVIWKFMNTLWMIFKNSIRRNRKISIISFRHWDKDKDWNLTKKGKKQANKLWKDLVKEIDKEWVTILAATHNVFNETVIRYIFSNEKLPEKWNSLLEFTESVKYTFHPQEWDKKPYLEVDWGGVNKKISYEDFQKLMENFNNLSSEEPSKLQE